MHFRGANYTKFTTFFVIFVVFVNFVTANERKPSQFLINDEWISLPDTLSVLDFNADSEPVPDEDHEGQMHLRSTRFWGRIYIEGWPQTIQYFRAHFGISPPEGQKRFVFAEPRDACKDLTNAEHITSDHVILVNRGTCTYGTKAKIVHKTNASAIVIINNEEGIDHLPGPDAHDIDFAISSISQFEGQLVEAVYDDGPFDPVTGFGRELKGFMIPITCTRNGLNCSPTTKFDKNIIDLMPEGGMLRITNADDSPVNLKPGTLPMEYLLAHFGTKVLYNGTQAVLAKPAEACGPLQNNVKGKIVLVRRGSCAFVKKTEEVQAAGGSAVIISSMAGSMIRMGVDPRWKGLNTAIPVVMVTKRVYSVLLAESYAGGKIYFEEDTRDDESGTMTHSINDNTWTKLEELHKGEGWPRTEEYVTKKYNEFTEKFKDYPDRLTAIKEGYEKKMKYFAEKNESTKSEL